MDTRQIKRGAWTHVIRSRGAHEHTGSDHVGRMVTRDQITIERRMSTRDLIRRAHGHIICDLVL